MSLLGQNNYVHGDIRVDNVLLQGKDKMFVIDFEYAGKVGEARYPTDLNQSIFFSAGIKPGVKIQLQHDLDQMKLLLEMK